MHQLIRASFRVGAVLACLALLTPGLRSEGKAFRIPAGDAAHTLAEFARQSAEQIVYLVDNVQGERTAAVDGAYTPLEALRRMLSGTHLAVHRDAATGAMIVSRAPARPAEPSGTAAPAASPAADEIVRLPEFTVSSTAVDRYRSNDAVSAVRVRAPLVDTPSSISVLTRDVIDDVMPTRIFDVTRYAAGVEEGRGMQFADRQIIRGFESNGRTVDNFFQSGADNIDEAVVDRIEISKGPNAILAPAGVPGGSINVITKSPRFAPHRSLTAVLGLFDAQKATLDVGGPLGADQPFAYRVIAAAQDSRRYWAPDARLRGKVLAPMLTWRASAQTQLTVKLVAAEHWVFREPGLILDPSVSATTGTPLLAPGFSYRSRNGIQRWSHVGTHTADLFALLTSALGDRVALRVAVNGRYYFEDSTQEFFSTPTFASRYNPYTGELTQDDVWALDASTGDYVPAPAPLFDPTAIPVRADTQKTVITTTNVQADVATRRSFGALTSQTVLGVALTHFDSVGRVRSGALPPLDLRRPESSADPVWSPVLYGDLRQKQTSKTAYLNERVGLLKDRLQLTGGILRYAVVARSHDHIVTPQTPSRLDDYRWLGLGSVLLKPAKNASLYFTHSTNSTPVIANNLPLWRDGVQDELGVKFEFFSERLSLTAARYRIRQSNVTVPNPEHQTDPNVPEQLIADLGDHGYEVELAGGLTTNLSVIGSYTRLRLRDTLGRPVRAVADETAALLLNYRIAAWRANKGAVFAGMTQTGRRAGDAPAVNFTPLGHATRQSFYLPPLTIVNAGASFAWGRWLYRLNVDNVFNVHDRLELAGGRVSGTGLTTAIGMNVKVSATLQW